MRSADFSATHLRRGPNVAGPRFVESQSLTIDLNSTIWVNYEMPKGATNSKAVADFLLAK